MSLAPIRMVTTGAGRPSANLPSTSPRALPTLIVRPTRTDHNPSPWDAVWPRNARSAPNHDEAHRTARAPIYRGPRIWHSILADYELEQRHEAILCVALEAFDRMRQAQAVIAEEGSTTVDRFGGAKPHRAVAL